MSGIIGTYHLGGRPASQAELRAMIETLAHRGPDRRAVWHEDAVGMGHALLAATPEAAHEQQPLVHPETGAVITADARLDNREELIRRLAPPRRNSAPLTDDALILAAYLRWGARCAEHLLGAFAFALWDPARQYLFCARDHFGVKPLRYYYRPGQLFAFGSEIKALLALEEVPRQLNEVRIGDYLATLDDATSTAYRHILRLPPAHTLVVSPAGLRLERYWQLEAEPAPARSDEAYTEQFRALFAEAVRCRMRSTTSVTSQLSGGLDSSAVTSVAQQLHTQGETPPVQAVAVTTDDVPESNERAYIDAVADYTGVPVHYIHGDRIGPLADLVEIYTYLDDEPVSGNHHFTWHMNRAARTLGSRVMLDGFDGDTTVSHGLPYFTELAYARRWEQLAREAERARLNHAPATHKHATQKLLSRRHGPLKGYGYPVLQQYARTGRWAAYARAARQVHRHFDIPYRHLARAHAPAFKSWAAGWVGGRTEEKGRPSSVTTTYPFIAEAFARRIHLDARAAELHVDLHGSTSARALQWKLLTSPHLTRILELNDYYAAAHSLEVRHPFMDKRLVAFCLSLPPAQRLGQGWTRLILRRALRGLVPESTRWRAGKAYYTPNFARGLFDLDRDHLDRGIENLGALRSFVNESYVRSMLERGPAIGDAMMVHLCKIVSLAFWMRGTFGTGVAFETPQVRIPISDIAR